MNSFGGHRPKKSLGQNFLVDPSVTHRIADVARINANDNVLEIGPGLGHLTEELVARAGRVLAIELDNDLAPMLQQRYASSGKVEIVHADALEYPYASLSGTWKVVANLPYYISTPIIQRLLAHRQSFASMTLMLQREVAERIAAEPGGKEYGYLSVLVQYYLTPSLAFIVPPEAFSPRPKIDSAVIMLCPRAAGPPPVRSEAWLMTVVKAAFSQRRKTLRNSLKQLGIVSELFNAIEPSTGIDPARRAETLSIEEFCRLSDFLQGS
jgi:16S rRNA (adenine1518-N6/adenine1519-N6)-dimethyltransferase